MVNMNASHYTGLGLNYKQTDRIKKVIVSGGLLSPIVLYGDT